MREIQITETPELSGAFLHQEIVCEQTREPGSWDLLPADGNQRSLYYLFSPTCVLSMTTALFSINSLLPSTTSINTAVSFTSSTLP